jgi:hypothetical protein
MKGYDSRKYAIEIVKPVPQTQKIFIGLLIRRTIGKGKLNVGPDALPVRTFRVRRGNGYYGSKKGETIQDQFDYCVPDPNADHVGITNKNDFAAAVAAWQALSDIVKKTWNYKAQNAHLHMSGYNYFIRKYRLGEI